MEQIVDFNNAPVYNRVYVNPEKSSLVNSKVVFEGKDNILFVEDGVTIDRSEIFFNSNNSVVYLSRSNDVLYLSLAAGQNSTVFIGRNCYFNGPIHILSTEWQNIIIGNSGIFSLDVWLRTADAHLIYDIHSKERTNYSKSILIGDHVWVGQNPLILKGTLIGSGSIVGGGSVVSNKRIASNTVYAGNPTKQVRSDVFWSGPCTHTWSEVDTQNRKTFSNQTADMWVYSESSDNLNLEEISSSIQKQDGANSRLSVVKRMLVGKQTKNKFYVSAL